MNKILIIAILVIGLQSNGFGQPTKDMDFITMRVDGLGCPFCAYGLEKKLKKLDGLKKFKMDIEAGVATFMYPTKYEIAIEMIENQVDIAGYTPVSTKIERVNGEVEFKEAEVIAEVEVPKESAETSLKVNGKCKMCKFRIEKVARGMDGIFWANWDKKSRTLVVKYDSDIADIALLHTALAARGHDTEQVKATKDAYGDLPACCLYNRKKL